MTTITLNVPDISCGHCKMSIEGAVSEMTGVGRVDVAIDARTVDLAFDDAAVSLDAIIEAIEEQGYQVAR
ncbi:MAG TPA: copper ion binding protein [Acidimicrobiia bacterium]